MSKDRIFIYWLIMAIFLRFIASVTNNSWQHPDDWFQTLEYAHFFSQGVMSYTQEVALHMRNLTWPFLLSLPLRLAYFIDPHSVFLRIFNVQFFTSILSLSILFFWKFRVEQFFQNKKLSFQEVLPLHFIYFFPVLTWFVYSDYIHPSQENISISLFFLALCFYEKKYFYWTGFFALACGLVRYPNGLLSLGIIFAVAIHSFKNKDVNKALYVGLGSLCALVFLGIPDWYLYGRPYESFWMYLHYNVVLSLGDVFFGKQSVLEYWVFLKGHFFRLMTIGFYPFLILSILGVFYAIKRVELWAWALIFYLIPHLFIGHKEGRFLRPIEFLLILSVIEYFFYKKAFLLNFFRQRLYMQKVKSQVFLLILFLGFFYQNFIYLGASLRGSIFKTNSTYMEVGSLLKKQKNICAIITVRLPASVLVPSFSELKTPNPSFLFFYASQDQPLEYQIKSKPLYELQSDTICRENQEVLFHFHKTDPFFQTLGCRLLETGVLNYLPKSMAIQFLENDKIRGPWYSCPSGILSSFVNKEKRMVFTQDIERFSGEELVELTEEKLTRYRLDYEKKYNIKLTQ